MIWITIGAGVKDLVIGVVPVGVYGILRDAYTTLPDVADRIATALTATWHYRTSDSTSTDVACGP